MSRHSLAEIKAKISTQHEGDEKQLEVIFSDSPRLIVEAPAGYGKTTTMISRIAYLFAIGGIPNPKRILGLTFSVNAALKVKREVAEKLPSLLGSKNSPVAIGEKVTVTNYHGFCKVILKKYGYIIADALRKDINLFRAVGALKNTQGNITPEWQGIAKNLTSDEQDIIVKVDGEIGNGTLPVMSDIKAYNDIVSRKLMPLDFVTHNAVILLVLEIFSSFVEVKKFYQSYFPLIVVDEFQDTNCIAWALLESVISEQTQLVFLGDPLQRIYGFIGALPDIMTIASLKYGMTTVTLSKNYRFRNNPEMLKLDRSIRANAAACFTPTIQANELAKLPAFWGVTQQAEAEQVVAKVQDLLDVDTDKIAILFRGRGKNAETVESELSNKQVEYFYGMFTDEDPEYIDFHNRCHEMFIKRFGGSKTINKKALMAFSDSVKKGYTASSGKTGDSLLCLLDALVEKVSVDYADLGPEDKYSLLLDIFENRQLKQAMEYVKSKVILSTVHGAKGLEWDYVFLADLERWVFPGYYTCNDCLNKYATSSNYRCSLPNPLPMDFRDTALDELSVFYVGVTRAKSQVFVSASAKRLDYYGKEKNSSFSCMAALEGIKLVKADS
jgi:DNA helicase-2/ATP-dependent DNA helicase PcrA